MSWGISIWGVHVWGGGPSSENLSFEEPDAGGVQGKADQWTIASDSEQEAVGVFEDTTATWDPWEDFEEKWQAPALVHVVPDTANQLTSPDATDQPTAIILANELAAKYPAHLRTIDRPASLQNGSDEPWVISDGATLTLKIDRGEEQTLTLTGLTPGAATAEEVTQSINQQLYNGRAAATSAGLRVTLSTIKRGRSAFLEVTGGTANAQMLFSTSEQVGTDNVHLAEDLDNMASFGPDPAVDYLTLAVVVMTLKYAYDAHVWESPSVHGKWDNINLVTSPEISLDPPNPAELPDLIVLLNELKADFNAHLGTQGYGDFNEESLFAFLPAHLSTAIFDPNLGSEGFERDWALRDMYPDLLDQREQVGVDGYVVVLVTVTGIPSDGQTFSITFVSTAYVFEFDNDSSWTPGNTQVDILGAATVEDVRDAMEAAINGLFAPAYAAIAEGSDGLVVFYRNSEQEPDRDFALSAVDLGTASGSLTKSQWGANWPGGHMELLDVFEYIPTQLGIAEGFIEGWLLPGSLPDWPNEKFTGRYLQGDGSFAFATGQLSPEFEETFEENWKENDTGFDKYWDGSKWRFEDTLVPPTRQLAAAGFGEEGVGARRFMYFMIDTPASSVYDSALPTYAGFSVDLVVKVVEIHVSPAIIQMLFVDGEGTPRSCYIVLDGSEVVGTSYGRKFAESASPGATLYYFYERWGGLKQITNAILIDGSGGRIEVRGYLGSVESFEESDWTLTLT